MLFDDVFESDRGNEYFLGTIILQKTKNIGTASQYDIIDGQQRLTTIQLLLACLRDNIESRDFVNDFQEMFYQKANLVYGLPKYARLSVREEDFFKNFVQEIGGTKKVKEYECINDAQRNLKNAIITFSERVMMLNQEEIQKLVLHISQNCIVIYVSTDDFNNAYKLFTIINDRGLQLRRIDILKTNNLQPTIITDEKEREKYSYMWEDMENDLGADEFEDLISYIRTILVKEKAKEDILKEFNNLVFNKGILKPGKEFINYIVEMKIIYDKLIIEKDIDLGKNTISYKNLIHLMREFLPSNEWIPPLLSYYKKFGTKKLFEFLSMLEMKVVVDWVIAYTPTKRTVNINSILKAIDESNTCEEVLNCAALNYDNEAFVNELRQDIYGKRHDKYILMKLDYLESEQDVERIYTTISVEHVLPQTPNPESNWTKIFSDGERLFYTNKLCNLVLLSKNKNSQARNFDFETKKKKYIEGKATNLVRTLKLLSEKEWTPSILDRRQKEILDFFSKS